MRKKMFILLAVSCLILGTLLIPLPIPAGFPFFALGFMLLVANSRKAASLIRRFRSSVRLVDQMFRFIEDKVGGKTARILRWTRPSSL